MFIIRKSLFVCSLQMTKEFDKVEPNLILLDTGKYFSVIFFNQKSGAYDCGEGSVTINNCNIFKIRIRKTFMCIGIPKYAKH